MCFFFISCAPIPAAGRLRPPFSRVVPRGISTLCFAFATRRPLALLTLKHGTGFFAVASACQNTQGASPAALLAVRLPGPWDSAGSEPRMRSSPSPQRRLAESCLDPRHSHATAESALFLISVLSVFSPSFDFFFLTYFSSFSYFIPF